MQNVRRPVELSEGVAGGAVGVDRGGAGFVHAVECGIGGFVRARVFAGRLAEIFCGGGHVEKVVGDLKQQPELRAVTRHCRQLVRTSAADNRATTRRRDDQRARLESMNLFQLRAVNLPRLRFISNDCPATMPSGVPAARANSEMSAMRVCALSSSSCAIAWNASVCSASPARIAVASSKRT